MSMCIKSPKFSSRKKLLTSEVKSKRHVLKKKKSYTIEESRLKRSMRRLKKSKQNR